VDFVIIDPALPAGSLPRNSTNGFALLFWSKALSDGTDFTHNEVEILGQDKLTNDPKLQPNTFRKTPQEKARPQRWCYMADAWAGPACTSPRISGGSTKLISSSAARLPDPGTTFADWPITYADLEPYYTKVEWEIGVSGLGGASLLIRRVPSLTDAASAGKVSGVIFERAAQKLGWHPFPARWRSYRSRVPDEALASIAVFVSRLAAKSAPSQVRWRPPFEWRRKPAAAKSAPILMSIALRRMRMAAQSARLFRREAQHALQKAKAL